MISTIRNSAGFATRTAKMVSLAPTLNNLIELDHRGVKFRTGSMLGFKNFDHASTTIAGVAHIFCARAERLWPLSYDPRLPLHRAGFSQESEISRICGDHCDSVPRRARGRTMQ
jgi:hypothetical protein